MKSEFSDPQWLMVDLGKEQAVGRVRISWETAFGKDFKIQLSSDGIEWDDTAAVTNGHGGIDEMKFPQGRQDTSECMEQL